MLLQYWKRALCYLLDNKFTAFINLSGIAGTVLLTIPASPYTSSTEQIHTNFRVYQAVTVNGQAPCTLPQAPATRQADSSFLHLFNFPLLHGHLVTATDNIQHTLENEQLAMIHL